MKLRRFALLTTLLSSALGARTVDRGLNLPVTQGTTRDGAFFQGLYKYDYHPDQVSRAANRAGFSALRLAVNVESANNAEMLQKHKAYIDSVGGRGIICMFDTSVAPGASWPRSGTVTEKLDKVAEAWRSVHSVFASYGDDVMYEIFNEPWGYKNDAATYVSDMTKVIRLAKLPENRVILAGLYGSADVQSVARAGWTGYLAYHVYVFWLPEGQRTTEKYSQRIQQDLAGLSSRVFITEFGVGLDGLKANVDEDELKQDVVRYVDQAAVPSDWHVEQPTGLDVESICAKYPGNAWCKKLGAGKIPGFSFAQKPSAANMAADVVSKAASIGADVAGKAANVGADVAAQAANVGADVAAQAANMVGADVAAQLGADPGAGAAPQSMVYQNDTMAFLRGMRDALLSLKQKGQGVRGLYHWHGWHNGDTWDFWDAANARSSRMIQMMMMDQGEGAAPKDADTDPYMSDFVKDDPGVHMLVARQLGPKSSAECPAECGAKTCAQGNEAEIGGKHLTGSFCTHNCSKPYGEMRYCGAGVGYEEGSAIDCGGCAHPPMCSGLPCWTKAPSAEEIGHPTFLQRRTRRSQVASLSL